MEGAAVSGQLFAALDLDDFAVRVKMPDLRQSQRIFLCMQSRYKYMIIYAKEVQVCPR